MGGKGTYAFKTLEMSLRMALKMGGKIKIRKQDSSLHEEPAYFDGMHKRVKNFISPKLWIFHPGMCSMQILAVMDCPKEDPDNIKKKFFDTFNKAMAEYLDEPGFHLGSVSHNDGRKGGKLRGDIEGFHPENFRKAKAVTCQWHFKNCAEKYIVNIPLDERISFCRYCRELCQAHTHDRYRTVAKKL